MILAAHRLVDLVYVFPNMIFDHLKQRFKKNYTLNKSEKQGCLELETVVICAYTAMHKGVVCSGRAVIDSSWFLPVETDCYIMKQAASG